MTEAAMRKIRLFWLVAAFCITTCFQSGVARATLYCEIVVTKDGFAAIRSAPSRSAGIVKKYPQDQLILLDDTRTPPATAKDWTAVSIEDPVTKRIVARGWLHKSLIKPDSCG